MLEEKQIRISTSLLRGATFPEISLLVLLYCTVKDNRLNIRHLRQIV
jgi:hypothetical protein